MNFNQTLFGLSAKFFGEDYLNLASWANWMSSERERLQEELEKAGTKLRSVELEPVDIRFYKSIDNILERGSPECIPNRRRGTVKLGSPMLNRFPGRTRPVNRT